MCPLPIAYYEDEKVDYRENNVIRGYQWMIGDALLATPLYGNDYETAQTRDVYLPEGTWIDYDTGQTYTGPKLLKAFSLPIGKTPFFVGGTGVVIEKHNESLVCRIYPVADYADTIFYHRDAVTESRIIVTDPDWGSPKIVDTDTGQSIKSGLIRHAWQFDLIPGHNYNIN